MSALTIISRFRGKTFDLMNEWTKQGEQSTNNVFEHLMAAYNELDRMHDEEIHLQRDKKFNELKEALNNG